MTFVQGLSVCNTLKLEILCAINFHEFCDLYKNAKNPLFVNIGSIFSLHYSIMSTIRKIQININGN